MVTHPKRWFPLLAKDRNLYIAALTWLSGIVCGCIFALLSDDFYFVLLESASCQSVSLQGLIVNVILPLILVLIGGRPGLGWLSIITIFPKVALFTACSIGLRSVYGNADWLVRIFLQFSDIFTLPVLCWLSLVTAKAVHKTAVCAAILWYIFVCLADYFVISPFFAGLIVK